MTFAACLLACVAGCKGDDGETETETETDPTTATTATTTTTVGTTTAGTDPSTSVAPTTAGSVTTTTGVMTTDATDTSSATDATETTGDNFMCPFGQQYCFTVSDLQYPGAPIGALAIGQLVNDGALDLVVGREAGFDILRGAGDGSFELVEVEPLPGAVLSIALADLDGDGDEDVAVTQSVAGEVRIYLNDEEEFVPGDVIPVSGFPRALGVTNLDVDTNVDLLVAAETDGGIQLLSGGGDGTFMGAGFVLAGSAPLALTVAPLAEGAFNDFLVANLGSNSVGFYPGQQGGFGLESSVASIEGPRAVAVGDFNGDDNLDFVVAGEGADAVGLALGSGFGTFTTPELFAAGLDPRALVAGDYDGDGALDIAVANRGSDELTLLLGDGNGSLGEPLLVFAMLEPSSLATADLNGDGGPDIVVASDGAVGGGLAVLATDGL